jgi:transposase InsO family protein
VDLARFVVRAVLVEKGSVREVALAHGISKSWLYELCARYREGGDQGLVPGSRRPHSSPSRTPDALEDEIVGLRKQLVEEGFDAGPETIYAHLLRRHAAAPSLSSIWRVLSRRGFIVPQPHKAPKRSFVSFEADLPNACWQMDMTHVEIADGHILEVLNVIDDHSRMCVGSVAFSVVKATDVVEVFLAAGERYGLPASVLSDNGAIFTAAARGGRCATETTLALLKITFKHSRPYHPETCGKIERFHQTMKRFLVRQDAPGSIDELQAQLDHFASYYNEVRPHRSKGRRTPAEVFASRTRAGPQSTLSAPAAHYRVRHDRVDGTGKITLRYESRLRHLAVGRAHKRRRVLILVADRDVRVLSEEGDLLASFTIDPSRTYQPRRAPSPF